MSSDYGEEKTFPPPISFPSESKKRAASHHTYILADFSILTPTKHRTMDYHSRGSKRRWASNNGDDATAASTTASRRRRDAAATSSSSQQRTFGKNDLSEKTTANIDGGDYGYLSSDDEHNTTGGKKKERTARKEQRMGVRSFPRASTATAADDESKTRSNNSASDNMTALPNPAGWTQLVSKRGESTSRPYSTMDDEAECAMSKSSGFTLSSATKKNKTNNPYAHGSKTPARNAINTPSSTARTLRSTNTKAPRSTSH
eukprot:scaffold1396_cov86-Skeletonema_marinoi.AAC.1